MQTVMRYEGLGSFTEGRSSLLRLSRSDASPRHEERPPISYGGGWEPKFDGLDVLRGPGIVIDSPRDDAENRPSPEDDVEENAETKTRQAQDAMFQRQKDAWKKKRDRSGVDVPIVSNRGNQGDLSGSLGDPSMRGDGDDAFAAGNQARESMVARMKSAHLRGRQVPRPDGGQ